MTAQARPRHDTYLSCEHAPIEPQVPRNVDQLDVRGHLLTHDDMNDVTRDERSGGNGRLRAVAEDDDVGGNHVLYGCHDAGRRKVLPGIEDRLEDDNDEEDDGQREVG